MDIHDREGLSCCCKGCTNIPARSAGVGKYNIRCIHWLLKYELTGLCSTDLHNQYSKWYTSARVAVVWSYSMAEERHGCLGRVQGIDASWVLWVSDCWPLPVLCDKRGTAAMQEQGRVHKAKGRNDSSTARWRHETWERGCAAFPSVSHVLLCTFVPPLSSWTRQRQCQLLNRTLKFTASNENICITYLLTNLDIILNDTQTIQKRLCVSIHPFSWNRSSWNKDEGNT